MASGSWCLAVQVLQPGTWPEIIPFLGYDAEISRVICSNAIESPNAGTARSGPEDQTLSAGMLC